MIQRQNEIIQSFMIVYSFYVISHYSCTSTVYELNRDQTAERTALYGEEGICNALSPVSKRSCHKSAHIWCTTNYSHHLTYFMHGEMIRFDLCARANRLNDFGCFSCSNAVEIIRIHGRNTLYWTFLPLSTLQIHDISAIIPFYSSVSVPLVFALAFAANRKVKKLCDKAIFNRFQNEFE